MASPDRATSPASSVATWLPRIIGWHAEAFRWCALLGWPLFDLALRILLAQGYFVSGVIKVTNWSGALYLSTYEYPVSWMNPVAAAYTGAAIELIGPVLLAAALTPEGRE